MIITYITHKVYNFTIMTNNIKESIPRGIFTPFENYIIHFATKLVQQ